MQVKIKNAYLGQAISLLFNLSLKGKQSRHRTKFIKLLDARLKEYAESEMELLKEYAVLDDKGEIVQTEDKKGVKLKDPGQAAECQKELEELREEELVIEGGDAQGMLKTVKAVLDECDKEFKGAEATTYDYLCEQFDIE